MGSWVQPNKEKQGIFAILEMAIAMTIIALLKRISR
jgi:hypothetical protein